jgi:hypothetical protein
MRETKAQIMEGVEGIRPRIIDSNTVEYMDTEGARIIRFHHTNIIIFHPNGDVRLDSGGWKTPVTKDRMNEIAGKGHNFHIVQDKSIWYVKVATMSNGAGMGGRSYPFGDGITIHMDGSVSGKGPDPNETLKLKARIKRYVAGFMGKLVACEIPQPSGGDCWGCSLVGKDGQTVRGNDHLLNHLDEDYYVPSLLMNAIKEIPVSMVANSQVGMWLRYLPDSGSKWSIDIAKQQVTKSLTRYLYRRLGMAA